jgi:hypothetical protein
MRTNGVSKEAWKSAARRSWPRGRAVRGSAQRLGVPDFLVRLVGRRKLESLLSAPQPLHRHD